MKTYQGNEARGLRYPAINDLIDRAENKYELVLATAKRARELVDGSDPLVKVVVDNPVSIATQEIADDEVKIVRFEKTPDEEIAETEELFEQAESAESEAVPTIAEMAEEEEEDGEE